MVDASGLRLISETWREDSFGRTRTRAFWSGPSAPELVAHARYAVGRVAAAGGVDGTRLDDVRTCVSEGVTNAVMHAFCDDRRTGRIGVSAEFSRAAFTVVITDDGRGFLPRDDSPGMGIGLSIVRAMSDAMHVGAGPGGGTALSIVFNLAEAPPALAAVTGSAH